jgi:hypothetical protein
MNNEENMPLKLLHTIDHHHETAASVDLSGNIGVDSWDHLLVEIADVEHELSKPRIRQGKAILQAAKARVIEDGYVRPVICLMLDEINFQSARLPSVALIRLVSRGLHALPVTLSTR